MNAELVKRQDRWDLYGEDGSKLASSAPNPLKRLSIKNCEAIERGYDLDELVNESLRNSLIDPMEKPLFIYGYKEGFQKALEILGDKKFSKNKLLVDFVYFLNDRHFNKYMVDTDEVDLYLESLQQTEWDVEIVMESQITLDYRPVIKNGIINHETPTIGTMPKLDKDGYLILRRL